MEDFPTPHQIVLDTLSLFLVCPWNVRESLAALRNSLVPIVVASRRPYGSLRVLEVVVGLWNHCTVVGGGKGGDEDLLSSLIPL
jgi:hypothetical protein